MKSFRFYLLHSHAARSKLSAYIVTLYGLSATACAPVKDCGVIIDPHYSTSFDAHVDHINVIIIKKNIATL